MARRNPDTPLTYTALCVSRPKRTASFLFFLFLGGYFSAGLAYNVSRLVVVVSLTLYSLYPIIEAADISPRVIRYYYRKWRVVIELRWMWHA